MSLKDEVKRLADALEEKRSDIAEELTQILNGEKFDQSHLEHRYATAHLPDGRLVEYDTLTTLMSVREKDGQWVRLNEHEYYD